MKISSQGHLRAGFDAVRTAKARSFWTMLGIVIGVASVIVIVSIGEGVKQQIGGQIKHRGKDLITVSSGQLRAGGESSKADFIGAGINAPLSRKDIVTVKKTKGVAASAPLTILTGSSKSNSGTYNEGFVIGTTPDLPALINQSVAYGSFINEEDMGTNVAILGVNAANKLFEDENVPLGRSFTYHGQEFIVRGIFNSFNSSPLNEQANFNNAIFIPDDVAASITKNGAPIYEILAKPDDPDKTRAVAIAVNKNLDASHGGQSNLVVKEGNQTIGESDSILSLLTRLIAGVAAISLIVAGIGIMNVMLVSVAERTHEIGIRKAIGATNRQILEQFMIESTVLCFFGGVLGVGVAYAVQISLKLATNLQPVITWQIVVASLFVSTIVGVVFGTIPALKAARRDPIDALRSE
ncbi:MAG: ABC transporter permease [Candidatus Saccharimonadales bacterium]